MSDFLRQIPVWAVAMQRVVVAMPIVAQVVVTKNDSARGPSERRGLSFWPRSACYFLAVVGENSVLAPVSCTERIRVVNL